MQTLDILNIIMEKTKYVPSGTTMLMVAQTLLSSYMQVMFYYKLIKNRDLLQKIFACILPAWLIANWYTIVPFTLGSFANGGLSSKYVHRIIEITLTDQFKYELIIVAVVYVTAVVIYLFAARPKWYQALSAFGLETAVLVMNLIVFAGLHRERLHLPDNRLPLFCIVVYGYYMVIYKTLLTVISLLAAALYHEKGKHKLCQDQRELFPDKDYEVYVIKFLNKRQKLTALTFAVTVTILVSVPTGGLLWESGLSVSLVNIITVLNVVPGLIILFMGVLGWACYLLVFAFFPRLSQGYRTLKQDSSLFEWFYYEVVQNYSPLSTNKEVSTNHFIVVKNLFFVNIIVKQTEDRQ